MTTFHDVRTDHIFYDTLWSFRSNQPKEGVVKEVDNLRATFPEGNLVSNYGGWQSDFFKETDNCPLIHGVMEEITEFTNFLCEQEGMGVVVEAIHGWANVNRQHSYNAAHRHGNRVDFIAIYYPRFPESSGALEILRDGGSALLRQNQYLRNGLELPLQAEEGFVYIFSGHLLHFVHPHPTDELRYSLSFNISCAPK